MPTNLTATEIDSIALALSTPRFGRYLDSKLGVAKDALDLYDWNARTSAAFLYPLGIMEVALRNGVAAAIAAEHGPDWHTDTRFIGSLPTPHGNHYNPRADLINTTSKLQRELNRKFPAQNPRPTVPAGKVVAELKFMFWVSMLTQRHDRTIWTPHIAIGFPGAPNGVVNGKLPRLVIHDRADAVRSLRNRIAHHEPIFNNVLRAEYAQIISVIRFRCRITARWVHENQTVTYLIENRP